MFVKGKRTVESGSNLDRLQRLKASNNSRDYQMHATRSKKMLVQALVRQKNKITLLNNRHLTYRRQERHRQSNWSQSRREVGLGTDTGNKVHHGSCISSIVHP